MKAAKDNLNRKSPAEQKAKELVDKMYYQVEDATAGMFDEATEYVSARKIAAKQCALICAEHCIAICPYLSMENKETLEEIDAPDYYFMDFWEQVKTEIEKL